MKTMLKLFMVAGFVGGLAVQSAVAGERDGGVSGASVEKSSMRPEKEKFSGDIRDCLYAKFGSEGIDYKEVHWWKHYAKRKCGLCNYKQAES